MEKSPIRIVSEAADTVTLLRADFNRLIKELKHAEDRVAVMEHRIDRAVIDLTLFNQQPEGIRNIPKEITNEPIEGEIVDE